MSSDERQITADPAEVTWLSFYQVIRNIEQDSKTRIGTDIKVETEPIRLVADAESTFPVAELAKMRQGTGKTELEISFFGLFGASGCLPRHYSQLITDRVRQKDFALRDFLNIFNHRLISLFYRAWEKHHYPIAFETAKQIGDTDRVRQAFQSFVGMLVDGHQQQLSVDDSVLLHYGGHFGSSIARSADLEAMLSDIFELTVRVQELVGQWLMLAPAEQSSLKPPALGGSWNQLGKDTVAGSKVWDVQNRFRLCLGPLDLPSFLEFLPNGKRLRQLVDVTRRYVGPQFDFDCQILLKHSDIPPLQLGSPSACLGWSTWLGKNPSGDDAADAIFQLTDQV